MRCASLTTDRYAPGGITLAEAREKLLDANQEAIAVGKSTAKEKARDKTRLEGIDTFGGRSDYGLPNCPMADSIRVMRCAGTSTHTLQFGKRKPR